MSVPSTALFAVRVLTYQGRIEWASASDVDLVPHLREISDRYEELKGVNDFRTAGLTAKSEWLAKYMRANRENDMSDNDKARIKEGGK